jgi:formylglycine-generating enzyme required for sulfatase activity
MKLKIPFLLIVLSITFFWGLQDCRAEKKIRVGITKFEVGDELKPSLGIFLYEMLLEKLVAGKKYIIIDQEEISRQLLLVNRDEPGISKLIARKQVFERLLIQRIFTGSLNKVGKTFYINLKSLNSDFTVGRALKRSCHTEDCFENAITELAGEFLLAGVPENIEDSQNYEGWKKLPPFLEVVSNTVVVSLDGLANGSLAAQSRQNKFIANSSLPLEVKTKKSQIHFRLIPPGDFLMGSASAEQGHYPDESPLHLVRITKPFYLGKIEISQEQWLSVMASNPSHFRKSGLLAPVENISWNDVQEFLLLLSRLEQAPMGVFRLPSEAEWEYAARGGTDSPLYTGQLTMTGDRNSLELDRVSWYGGNSGVFYSDGYDSSAWAEKQYDHSLAGTHPSGLKQPNSFGLYDMIGNVWEWCNDWYHKDYYKNSPEKDPSGPAKGLTKVRRGCSWGSGVRGCRVANHYKNKPSHRGINIGFRIAFSPL